MSRHSAPFAPVALLALLAAPGCGGADARERTAVVFAAASLTAPFQALRAAFEERHPGTALDLHFAGTPQLVVQLREGAAADVLATADERSMQRVVDAGLTAGAPRVFAHNGLAIVVAAGNPRTVGGLADLAREDLRVALCGPEVPAGRYARLALERAGVRVRSVSDEPSVNAVVGKVWLGEVDAGLVYATDTRAAADRVAAVAVAADHDVLAAYPIAVLSSGAARGTGEAFARFVDSAEGREVLRSFGFRTP